MNVYKICKVCDVEKSTSEFSARRGLCNSCRSEKRKKEYQEQKEKEQKEKEQKETENQSQCDICSEMFSQLVKNKCVDCNEKFQNAVNIEIEKINNELTEKIESDGSGYVYMITSELYQTQNLYKIGYHTGSLTKLKSRYKTYLIDPICVRFVKCYDYKRHEKTLHRIFSNYRQNDTEWFKLDGMILFNMFDNYFDELSAVDKLELSYKTSIEETYVFNILKEMMKNINSPISDCIELTDACDAIKETLQKMLTKYRRVKFIHEKA